MQEVTPGCPVMSRVATDIIFMFYAVRSKRIDESLDTRVESPFCFQFTLTDKKVVDLVIYVWSIEEL